MQVKAGKFGRSGQTKWKHLAAEDTSRPVDDPWRDADRAAAEQRKRQMEDPSGFEKPKKFKAGVGLGH